MSLGLPVGVTTALAATTVAAYLWVRAGLAVVPLPLAIVGIACGVWLGTASRSRGSRTVGPSGGDRTLFMAWLVVTLAVLAALLAPVAPRLLPPGGASDLTHHLMLVDVIERTLHLVDGPSSEGALGEMAHYTPGLHLLLVVAGAVCGVDAYRTAYPLLALTVALKAGFVFLAAADALGFRRGRLAFALAAVGFVLFAPRAYSLDGFLQAGFYAQVAAELFVVAGWWGLSWWRRSPSTAWTVFVGVMGAAVFLVWPIWIGPLLVTIGLVVITADGVSWPRRVGALLVTTAPLVVVGILHLVQHAAWLRMAGTSGAVPALVPGPLGWTLMGFAAVGVAATLRLPDLRLTLWCGVAVLLQGLALWGLARARGAETPYMAMKMIYLAVYPVAILAAAGLAWIVTRLSAAVSPRAGTHVVAAWGAALLVVVLGVRAATWVPLPPPIVDVDLATAGRWARANLSPDCVDYIVEHAEQAYWLHLAVMGQPRASARTADLDVYTTNRAVGRWLEGVALPYIVARRDLLPGEVLAEADVVADVGRAVVLQRSGVECPVRARP